MYGNNEHMKTIKNTDMVNRTFRERNKATVCVERIEF